MLRNKINILLKNFIIYILYLIIIYFIYTNFEFELISIKNISIILISFLIFYKLINFIYDKVQKYKHEKFLSDNLRIKANLYQKSNGVNAHFYGKGTKIKIGDFYLRSPLIYTTNSLDIGLGENIPFLIFSEMNLKNTRKRIEIIKDREISNYTHLTHSEKKSYLRWLSNRRGKVYNYNFILLYLKGLEYRFFSEGKDKKIIFNEVMKLYSCYFELNNQVDECVFNLIKNMFNDKEIYSNFSLEEFDLFLKKYNFLLNKRETHELKWNYYNNIRDNLSYDLVTYSFFKNKKFINYLNKDIKEVIYLLLFNNLGEEFLKELKVAQQKKEVKTNNFVYEEIEYFFNQKEKIDKVLNKILIDLKPFLNEINKKNFLEAYTLLPIKYKKIIKHPYSDKINKALKRKSIIEISKIVSVVDDISFKEGKLSRSDSRLLTRILNDNFFAVEPDYKYTGKAYKENEIVTVYKNGNKIICKSKNFKNKQYLIDLVMSNLDENFSDYLKIYNFIEKNFPSENDEEKKRVEKRIRLNLGERVIDLRSIMSYQYNKVDVKKIIKFLELEKKELNIKDHRMEKIKEILL